jgi:predicted HTH domain antitoxin
MTLKIPDEILKAAHLDEKDVLVELASHLFDTNRLTLIQAARLADLDRTQFEDELHRRRIAIYRFDEQAFRQDLQAIEKMNGRGS